jgi:hypothetical protein
VSFIEQSPQVVRMPQGRPDALRAKRRLARGTPSRGCDRPGDGAGGPPHCGHRTRWAASAASCRAWHSHTLTTVHPCSWVSRVERSSRCGCVASSRSRARRWVRPRVSSECSGQPCDSTRRRTRQPDDSDRLAEVHLWGVLTLRRPARCPPRSVLTHPSATTPTYFGCTPD